MNAPPNTTRRTGHWARRLNWLSVVAWAAVIFAVSARPGSTLPGGYSVQGHLGEYFILGALLFVALRGRRSDGNAIAIAVIIASLYGVTDEFHQHFVALRTPDVADWGLDTIGAFLGATAAYSLTRLHARRGGTAG